MTSISNLVFLAPFEARRSDEGISFSIIEPWYRSLPVSCIENLSVQIDGIQIDPERITIEIDGQRRSLTECADAHDSVWFIRDRATVHVQGVQSGDTAQITAHLVMRIPYIMVGPTQALPRHIVQSEQFTVMSA
jgi:hypothetical protein